MIAPVDASVLFAAADRRDAHHDACLALLRRADLELVIPALTITEAAPLIGQRGDAVVEARFVRGLVTFDVQAPDPEDWLHIADLIERYADFPLGTVDASVAVLADRLGTDLILTLDRRHFEVIRSTNGRPYRLLPD